MLANTPAISEASGIWFRSDGSGGSFLCGGVPAEGEVEITDRVDNADLVHVDDTPFEQVVWPILAERPPGFEASKVKSSWAGFYEYPTFDQKGVVEWHPDLQNMWVAYGFSGHGRPHALGFGRACAELLLHGGFKTLSSLSFSRFVRGEPFVERGIY